MQMVFGPNKILVLVALLKECESNQKTTTIAAAAAANRFLIKAPHPIITVCAQCILQIFTNIELYTHSPIDKINTNTIKRDRPVELNTRVRRKRRYPKQTKKCIPSSAFTSLGR